MRGFARLVRARYARPSLQMMWLLGGRASGCANDGRLGGASIGRDAGGRRSIRIEIRSAHDISAVAYADRGRHARALECIVALLESAPKAVPFVAGIGCKVRLRHAEGEDLHLNAILTVTERLIHKLVDLLHDRIGHGKAADGRAAAVQEDIGTCTSHRTVESIGKADVDGKGVAPASPQLFPGEGVKALGRLPVALVLLGSQFPRPEADREGGKELEAIVLAHPELELGLPFEDADH